MKISLDPLSTPGSGARTARRCGKTVPRPGRVPLCPRVPAISLWVGPANED